MVRFTMHFVDENHIVNSLGIPDLNYFAECGHGGGASCATVLHAAAAVATGMAKCVVCYRTMNERSGHRYGHTVGMETTTITHNDLFSYIMPFGSTSAPIRVGTFMTRYLYEFGATPEQLAQAALVCRENANRNPRAMFYDRPLTMEEYIDARMVADPLRRYDCCVDTDGAVAVIITSAQRARDCKQQPAYILGATQGTANEGEMMTSYFRPRISGIPESWYTSQELWRVTGVEPKDVDVAQFYDAFTCLIPMQLEEYGFCGTGRGLSVHRGGRSNPAGG